MTFTIVSVSTASEVITIRYTLTLFCAQYSTGGYNYSNEQKVIIEEIHTESIDDKPPLMDVVWEWFDGPSYNFVEATGLNRLELLHACRDEIVRQSRRES